MRCERARESACPSLQGTLVTAHDEGLMTVSCLRNDFHYSGQYYDLSRSLNFIHESRTPICWSRDECTLVPWRTDRLPQRLHFGHPSGHAWLPQRLPGGLPAPHVVSAFVPCRRHHRRLAFAQILVLG